MLELRITHPQHDLQILEAPYGSFMIGSDASNRIVLDDGSVEEAHAVLTLREDESYIEDLMGAGVFVNGERIDNRRQVFKDVPIQIGNYSLVFGIEGQEANEEPAPAPPSVSTEIFKPKPINRNVGAIQKVKQQIHEELVERLDRAECKPAPCVQGK